VRKFDSCRGQSASSQPPGTLGLPVIEKDQIKEALYDTLGVGDVAWSQQLGTASYALILLVVRQLLGVGRSVIAKANFFRGSETLIEAHGR
jgi:hypothetical protein